MRFHSIALGAAIATACAAVSSPSFAGPAPKIQFKEYEVNLGEMYQDEERSHVFVFTNAGDAPLVVTRTHTSCGCTAALATQGPVPPGGSGEIKVTYNSKRAVGDQSKSVSVYTNAPDSITTLVVKARVKRDVSVPASIQFGQVSRGAPSRQEADVSAEKGLDFRIVKVEGDAPYITAEVAPATPKEGEGVAYKLTATLSADAPIGPVNNRLRIFTNLAKKPVIEVPVYATVTGDLKVNPSAVNFGTFKPGQAQEVVLSLEAPATHPIHVTSVRTSTTDVIALLRAIKEGRAYEVRCTVSPSKQAGRITGKLIIETSDPVEARREVQLMGFVRG